MDELSGMVLLIALCAFYAIPTIVACVKKHPARDGIAVVNLILGWTLLGWVAALAWAFNGAEKK